MQMPTWKVRGDIMNIGEKIKVIFVGRKALIIRSKVDEWLENNISKCF